MKVDLVFLRSKVARRVFFLFVLCALLPVTVLAVLSFTHVTQQLSEQSQKRLRQSSKAMGMAIYERLLLLEAELKLIGSKVVDHPGSDASRPLRELKEDLGIRYKGITLVTDAGRSLELFGHIEELPVLTAPERRHIEEGKTLLSTKAAPGHHSRIHLARFLDPEQQDRGMVLAEVNGPYLWGMTQAGSLPYLTEMCVVTEPLDILICSFDDTRSFSAQIAERGTTSVLSPVQWRHNDQDYLAGVWPVPLKFRFFSPSWTVVLSEPKSLALAAMENFKQTFPIVILLSLSVVGLLSLNQIRRSLVPLEQLQEGTRRIAKKDFASRVTVESGDEFQDLATSFNSMATQLGRQFHTLETIGEIDRAVLSAVEANKIVDTVLARIRDVFPSDCVCVTLRDPDKDGVARTYLRSGKGEEERAVEGIELTLTDLQALHENPDHLIAKGRDLPRFLVPLARRGATSCLVLPLFRAERLSGFIALGYASEPRHSAEDLAQARQVANQVAAALANSEDLAERKRAEGLLQQSNRSLEQALAELKSTQKQMIQQERLRALGQMASGIAHDFNNTLSPIVGFSELLLLNPKKLDEKDKLKEHLRIIHTAARDASKVVSRLRDFYRPREKEDMAASVNVNPLVEQTIRLTQPKWKDQALADGITIDVHAELGKVEPVAGNESELREVLTNLVFNAADAITGRGAITLRTRADEGSVVIEVSDTGVGMTEEVRQRCLEPFFSTKGDKGTGLGLSMVYGIIRRHQGTVELESELGKGTTFRIRLPITSEQGSEGSRPESDALPTGLHVLVVDDDQLVRTVTTEFLTNLGYTVDVATNGEEALQTFRGGRFDLVITDGAMPGMSGEHLATAVKQIATHIPVVLLTGAEKVTEAGGETTETVDFVLSKPLTMNALKEVLRKVRSVGGSSQKVQNRVRVRS